MVIFFDIDGTLVNQRRAEAAAAQRFLARYGDRLPHGHDVTAFCAEWRRLRERHGVHGRGLRATAAEHRRRRMRELFAASEPGLGDAEIDARLALWHEHYRAGWDAYDDVRDALESLASRHTLGVVSNGHVDLQRAKLRTLGLLQYFDVVTIAEEAGAAKPDARIFHLACRRARVRAAECVHVGDRLDTDVHGSRGAGLRGIWLNRLGEPGPGDVEALHTLGELAGSLADAGNASATTAAGPEAGRPPSRPARDAPLRA